MLQNYLNTLEAIPFETKDVANWVLDIRKKQANSESVVFSLLQAILYKTTDIEEWKSLINRLAGKS